MFALIQLDPRALTRWQRRNPANNTCPLGESGAILSCLCNDDKGNAILYEYAAENEDNVDRSQANDRNRVRTANRYLKRVKYGNRTPNRDAAAWEAGDPNQLPKDTWMLSFITLII